MLHQHLAIESSRQTRLIALPYVSTRRGFSQRSPFLGCQPPPPATMMVPSAAVLGPRVQTQARRSAEKTNGKRIGGLNLKSGNECHS